MPKDNFKTRLEIAKNKVSNKNRQSKLTHTFHNTTFIPFFPFGLDQINIKTVFNAKNIKYIPTYIIYLSNRLLGTRFTSIKKFFKYIFQIIRTR